MSQKHINMNDSSDNQNGNASLGKVLLVDDDKFLVDMYSVKFTKTGFTVQVCLSAEEALETLRKGFAAHVILLDLVMPERDGFSFLETLRAEGLAPDAALIALTNQGNDSEKKRAEELGCDRYIVKASMIPSEVVEVVKEEIHKKSKIKN